MFAVPQRPRHPNAPCDEQGRRVAILYEVDGIALVCRPTAGSSRVYLGELDSVEGVVHDLRPTTRAAALRLFTKLRGGE